MLPKRGIKRNPGKRGFGRSKLLGFATIAVMVIALAAPAAIAEPYNWKRVNTPGFGKTSNFATKTLVEYDGKLYAGVWGSTISTTEEAEALINKMIATGTTIMAQDIYENCEVWVYDGSEWTAVATGGFGDSNNGGVRSMAVYDGTLYAGTDNRTTGCEVFKYNGGTSWTQINTDGFGSNTRYGAEAIVEYNGSMYVSTKSYGVGGRVYKYNGGSSWTDVTGSAGFGDSNNVGINCMAVYGDNLYAGTANSAAGCQVWSYDGSSWSKVTGSDNGFGDADNLNAWEMEIYNGKLYVTTENQETGVEVWAWDGSSWSQINTDGFGSADNVAGMSMAVFNNRLLVGTDNYGHVDGQFKLTEVWELNGTIWSKVNNKGYFDGDYYNLFTWSLGTYDGKIYAGTLTPPCWGTEIYTIPGKDDPVIPIPIDKVMGSTDWFLAEGSTGGGFDTWILLQNPQDSQTAHVEVTFTTHAGPRTPVNVTMPPESRATVRIADTVPNDFHVSTIVHSDIPIVVERSMYWDKHTAGDSGLPGTPEPYEMKGGHANLGVPLESVAATSSPTGGRTTYFPEGATGGGFDTWILLVNPTEVDATANVKLMTQRGVAANTSVDVHALSRQTVHLDEYLPDAYEVSTEVSSSSPIVAERAMYWDPNEVNLEPYQMAGGHSNDGAPTPNTDWFLAEGSTGGGFDTWILVQNPNDESAAVHVSFMNQSGVVGERNIAMDPNTRATLRVSDTVPNDFHVSTRVESDKDVVAERAMYWDKSLASEPYLMRDGHATVGVANTGTVWMVPEGSTGGGFDSWNLITNVNDFDITAWVMFMTHDGPREPIQITVPAHARYTVHVNQYVPNDFHVSTLIVSENNLVVERAMYWDSREVPGIQPHQMMGGHSAVGVDP